jgi:hypothetical protein
MTQLVRTPRLRALRKGRMLAVLLAALAVLAFAHVARLRAQTPPSMLDLAAGQSVHKRQDAQDELTQARQAVAQARQAVAEAKSELDATLADTPGATSDADRSGIEDLSNSDAAKLPAPDAADAAADPTASPDAKTSPDEIDSLRAKVKDLKRQRDELLTHLTPAHPLVIEAEARLVEYSRLLSEALASEPVAPAQTAASPENVSPPADSAHAEEQAREREQAAARLQRALADWQAAEQTLQAAIEGELAAAEKLATLGAQPTLQEADRPTPQAAATPKQSIRSESTSPSTDRGSQALVLAALIIALVVAALVSVKLARVTDETVFSGPDDAAAALALPVLGVIPAISVAPPRAAIGRRFRALVVLGQALLAVVVFAIVAYLVQNPAVILEFLTAPLKALGKMAG